MGRVSTRPTGPTGARSFTSSGYALLFDTIELHGSGSAADTDARYLDAVLGDVRVRATAAGPGAFVGIGPADAVAGYLAAVDRERLVDFGSGRAVQQRLPGGAPATPPAQQTFWVASAAGPGPQQLTWTPTDGRWVVAVMNADGSRPVAVELSAGATLPHLRWLWIGLFVGAALALVVGAVLVLLAVRRAQRGNRDDPRRRPVGLTPGSWCRAGNRRTSRPGRPKCPWIKVESRCRRGSPDGQPGGEAPAALSGPGT